MASKEDVEELGSRLGSDKAKVRKEAIKELNSYLQGAGGGDFVALLDQESANLHDKNVPIPAASWPGLLQALCECIYTEVLAAKKRPPENVLAKTFKAYVQKAEEGRGRLFLWRKALKLFQHIEKVLQDCPNFVMDYAAILRQVLQVPEYRMQMGKKTLPNLIDFFMRRTIDLAHSRLPRTEEAFRNVATLQMLLQLPPRDLPEDLRKDVTEGFSQIFANLKDDGRNAEKMLASLNALLLSNGLDLGNEVASLHADVRSFLHSTWLQTSDRRMKATLVTYARLQMQLRGVQLLQEEEGALKELAELVSKDLDQTVGTSTAGRGVILGMQSKQQENRVAIVEPQTRCLLELAAIVLSETAWFSSLPEKGEPSRKRRKKQLVFDEVLEKALAGKGSWPGAFCMMVQRRSEWIPRDTLLVFLQAFVEALPGAVNAAAASRAVEPLVWMLRCLKELAAKWPTGWGAEEGNSAAEVKEQRDTISKSWQSLWHSGVDLLLHQGSVQSLAEEALRLLGCLAGRGLVSTTVAPPELFELRLFTEACTPNALHFVAAFFSGAGPHFPELGLEEEVQIRKRLLQWTQQVLSASTSLVHSRSIGDTELLPVLFQSALLALAAGFSTLGASDHPFWEQPAWWNGLEESERKREQEIAALDRSEKTLASFASQTTTSFILPRSTPGAGHLPSPLIARLMKHAAAMLTETLTSTTEQTKQQFDLAHLLLVCAACARCLDEANAACKEGYMRAHTSWGSESPVRQALASALETCSAILNGTSTTPGQDETDSASAQRLFIPQLAAALETLVAASEDAILVMGDPSQQEQEPLLDDLARAIYEALLTARDAEEAAEGAGSHGAAGGAFTQADGGAFTGAGRVLDDDLDMDMEIGTVAGTLDTGGTIGVNPVVSRSRGVNALEELMHTRRLVCLRMLAAVGQRRPGFVAEKAARLLRDEKKGEVRGALLSALCEMMCPENAKHLPRVVTALEDSREELHLSEESRVRVLRNIEVVSTRLNSVDIPEQYCARIAGVIASVMDLGLHFWQSYCQLADALAAFMHISLAASEPFIDLLMELMQSPLYHVRRHMARIVPKLLKNFRDEVVLDELINKVGVKFPVAGNQRLVTFAEVESAEEKASAYGETAVLILAEAAAASEGVEADTVFMMCAFGALHTDHRSLIAAVLDHLAKRLGYSERSDFLHQHLPTFLTKWVTAGVPLVALIGFRDVLHGPSSPREFLLWCMDWLLPPLVLAEKSDQLARVAELVGDPLSALLKQSFPTVFASLIAVYCEENEAESERVAEIMQGSLLQAMGVDERQRDEMTKKKAIAIVSELLTLASASKRPQLPLHSRGVIGEAICTLVDGMVIAEERQKDSVLQDTMQILRADRTFSILLQLHSRLEQARSPRHKRPLLAGLGVLVDIMGQRLTIPSTFRYMARIILQFVSERLLQNQCCELLRGLLDQIDLEPDEETVQTLGDQLQFIVSKLVTCCLEGDQQAELADEGSPLVLVLLRRLTVEGPEELHDYVRDLDPFPDVPIFQPMRTLHAELRQRVSLADDFVHFVNRAALLPPQVCARSLASLKLQLKERREELFVAKGGAVECRPDVIAATWRLVQQSDQTQDAEMRDLAGAFLAVVRLGDPRAVAFHLPTSSEEPPLPENSESQAKPSANGSAASKPRGGVSVDPLAGVSDSVVREALMLLRVYLIDDSVTTIHLAADTLKGLLATEKGNTVLESLPSADRAYLDIHTRGVSLARANEMLAKFAEQSAEVSVDLSDEELWRPEGKTHEHWVSRLVHSLLEHVEDGTLRLCQPMALQKGALAELLLPHVLGAIAAEQGAEGELYATVSRMVQQHVMSESNTSTRAMQVMLEAMNSLRQCHVRAGLASSKKISSRPGSARLRNSASEDSVSEGDLSPLSWPRVYYLNVDYLAAAKAAQQCAAFFTSLLSVEHWCEHEFQGLTLGAPDFSDENQVPLHEQLLLNVYAKINEPDGIYGVARTHKAASQLCLYEHEGSWGKALGGYDNLLRSDYAGARKGSLQGEALNSLQADIFSQGGGGGVRKKDRSHEQEALMLRKEVMRSLQQMGCLNVLDTYWQGLQSQRKGSVAAANDAELIELQYENAWRMGQWDLGNLPPGSGDSPGYNALLHGAFKALSEGNSEAFEAGVTSARQGLVRGIAHTSAESSQSVNPAIVRLQILEGLEEAWSMRWYAHGAAVVPSDVQVDEMDERWQGRFKQVRGHFELVEPLLEVRGKLLQLLDRDDRLPGHFLELAQTARKAGHFSTGAGAIRHLKSVAARLESALSEGAEQSFDSGLLMTGRTEEAKILWAQGQQEMAVNLVTYLAGKANSDPERAALLTLAGKWHAETRSASSRVIMQDYLTKAAELYKKPGAKGPGWRDRMCRTYFRLGRYADLLYKNCETRMQSSEYQATANLRALKSAELESILKRLKGQLNAEDKQAYRVKAAELNKQLLLDKEEEKRFQEDRTDYLFLALRSYRCCLRFGDKYDMRVVFRLISLWFNLSQTEAVNQELQAAVREVPSHKFLPLVYQIASRMSKPQAEEPSLFQTVLMDLVIKLASEHPYHSLYQVLALKHGDRVKDVQRSRHVFIVDVEKKRAAEEVLRRLPPRLGPILQEVLRMVELYIEIAEAETAKEDQQKRIPVPRNWRSVKELTRVPVITAHIPVDPSCQYAKGTFPYFVGLTESIKIMNGINAPKLIECIGSDGQRYKQLAKSGNDDLRQDAVMEQLFGLVSGQLQDHPETRKRQLNIRTYKVIPFTPTAGVLEWVNGTVPLGEYLLGSTRAGGAHGRYGSKEWTFHKCRDHIVKAEDKRGAFAFILENTKPVFHHFFLERFARPADWFEKRLAYTRSVAASSMVGYIMGLGDRHSMNILLDEATAEVVHIDLGVAFEQGLMLKTPERVPFRLTRDIVDGMGVCGVHGVFRRCCEETLAVMRANKESLLTIVEVFIHDPLYKWALSPLKALHRQRDESPAISEAQAADVANGLEGTEGNADATRALLRVKEKLDGYEEGEMRSLQGQVQQLIQDAQDPERLCQMFPGWGAWL